MKNFKVLFLLMAFAAVGMTLTSCGEKKAGDAVEAASDEAASRGIDDGRMADPSLGSGTPDKTSEEREEGEEGSSSETIDKSAIEYSSFFVCPMHCKGSGSPDRGKCPVCGMDYVRNENIKPSDLSEEERAKMKELRKQKREELKENK
jgi:hypothetical protein